MCYFSTLFDKIDEVVDTVDHYLKHPRIGKVDIIVGIGLSGTMPLISVGRKSGIDVCAMRKKSTESHGGSYAMKMLTNRYLHRRYVILDDFVDSGNTLKGLRRRLHKLYPTWTCVGVLLYNQSHNDEETFDDVPVIGLGDEIDELHKLWKEEKAQFPSRCSPV